MLKEDRMHPPKSSSDALHVSALQTNAIPQALESPKAEQVLPENLSLFGRTKRAEGGGVSRRAPQRRQLVLPDSDEEKLPGK